MPQRDALQRSLSERLLTRRGALASLGAVGLAAAGVSAARGQTAEGTPEAEAADATPAIEINREATMPDWRFTVISLNDPYGGTLSNVDAVPAGTRVVAAQVILSNHSNIPMEVDSSDVRLRDIDGIEYRPGEFVGEEPRLVSQILPDGERTRGWVWFGIPANTTISSLIFLAPRPTLRVRIDEGQ